VFLIQLLRQYNRIVRLAGGPRMAFCAELFRLYGLRKHSNAQRHKISHVLEREGSTSFHDTKSRRLKMKSSLSSHQNKKRHSQFLRQSYSVQVPCVVFTRFEHDAKHDVPEFPSWAVREKPQLTDGSITHLRIKAEGGDKKVCYAHCFYDGGGPKFLNSGGFMGPVKYLHEMVNEVDAKMSQFLFYNVKGLEAYRKAHGRRPGDQHFYWDYFLAHRDLVTLDYLGAVFQAMAGVIVESGAIGVNETGALYNQYFDEKICLAHFNAGAHFSAADSVIKMLGGVSSV